MEKGLCLTFLSIFLNLAFAQESFKFGKNFVRGSISIKGFKSKIELLENLDKNIEKFQKAKSQILGEQLSKFSCSKDKIQIEGKKIRKYFPKTRFEYSPIPLFKLEIQYLILDCKKDGSFNIKKSV